MTTDAIEKLAAYIAKVLEESILDNPGDIARRAAAIKSQEDSNRGFNAASPTETNKSSPTGEVLANGKLPLPKFKAANVGDSVWLYNHDYNGFDEHKVIDMDIHDNGMPYIYTTVPKNQHIPGGSVDQHDTAGAQISDGNASRYMVHDPNIYSYHQTDSSYNGAIGHDEDAHPMHDPVTGLPHGGKYQP